MAVPVSVVMTSYRKAAYLELTLASWARQDYPDLQVVVCDDGTPGGLRHVVEPFRSRLDITLVEQTNRGRAAARNTALRAARGDLVIFSDDDRIVPPDFATQHAAAVTTGDAVVLGYKHEVLGVVDPRLPLPRPRSDEAALRACGGAFSVADVDGDLLAVLQEFDLGPGYDNADDVLAEFGDDLAGFRLPWALATTANMSVSRDLLGHVGGFNESFTGWGGEDTELAFRLVQAGGRVSVARRALNYHQVHPRAGNPTIAVAGPERTELLRNLRYLARLHPCIEMHLFYRSWLRRTSLVTVSRMIDLIRGADEQIVAELGALLSEQVPVEEIAPAFEEPARRPRDPR